MAYTSSHFMFRSLTDAEEVSFREYAQTNEPDLTKWEILHPVCRDEWVRMGKDPGAKQ